MNVTKKDAKKYATKIGNKVDVIKIEDLKDAIEAS